MEDIISLFRACFSVFDVRIDVVSSAPTLLAAADQAYADWRCEADGLPSRVQIRLEPGEIETQGEDIRVDGARLFLRSEVALGEADARTGQATARVAPWLAEDPAALAARVVDTLLLWSLTRADRTPLHAAGVMLGGAALALAGPSGSGKSTLALAAMARGLPILSDDTLYIQLRPRLKLWGLRRPLHVFPRDAPGFTTGTRFRGGKLKAVAPLAPEAFAPAAERAVVVLLARGDRLDLTRLDPEATVAGLSQLEPGFDLLARETAPVVGALAARGGWRLTLTRDPGAAIDFLRERLPVGIEG